MADKVTEKGVTVVTEMSIKRGFESYFRLLPHLKIHGQQRLLPSRLSSQRPADRLEGLLFCDIKVVSAARKGKQCGT